MDYQKLTKNELITFIKNLEQQILNEENMFLILKTLSNIANFPILIFEKDFVITFANSTFYEVFQTNPDEIISNKLLKFISKQKADFLKYLVKEQINIFNLELQFNLKYSNKKYFTLFIKLPLDDKYLLLFNNNIDKTIIDDIYLYRTILDNAPIGILITNLNDKAIYTNDILYQILDLEHEIEYGKDIKKLITYEIKEIIKKDDNYFNAIALINEKKAINVINTYITYNNTNIGKIGIYQDITDKYLIEQELNKTVNVLRDAKELLEIRTRDLLFVNQQLEKTQFELKKTIDLKDKFFSVLAHDLRSPFNALLGYMNILNDEFEDLSKEEIKYFIEQAKEVTDNTYKLLLNLLSFSRIQAGRIEFNPKIYKFKDIVDNVINLLKGNILQKEIDIQLAFDDNIEVKADEKMLASVLQNLIGNAIKFSFPNGKIIINAQKDEHQAIIFIKDFGTGMSQQTLEQLFKLDMIVTKQGTNNESGSGLGLLICKEFINKHSGQIWVESELNKGTTFYFTLPN
ncbi:MAG TPA: PAS domain-containing sensor histidine kinase [Ignavibacteriales bacterium]|nr:PAS domain-containing sensor histidine kinase [Ignavibacteriales bacterium]